jgi:signal transduction histidine kinase/CheY-like chemotaxis protein
MPVDTGVHLVSSLCFNLSLVFLALLEPPLQIAQVLLLIAISSNGMSNPSGYWPLLLSHIVAVVTPLLTMGFVYWDESPTAQYALVTLVACYIAGQVTARRRNHGVFYQQLQARMELESGNSQLRLELGAAKNDLTAKSKLFVAASHDLRQPIHSMTLCCSSLSMKPLDSKVRDIANHMTIAVETLNAQLDAILDVAKLDAGIVPVNKLDINLAGLLSRIYSDFLPLARAKELALQIDCPPECGVFTDSSLLERMLRNLLSNAIKYTDTGEVRIQVVTTDFHVFVNIIDTGIGIAKQDQEHIFEEYHQLNDSDRNRRKHLSQFNNKHADRRKGLGLGLSIVHRHAKLLASDLKLHSALRMGSTFSLKLVNSYRRGTTNKTVINDDRFWSTLTVLVVDDEIEIRQGTKILLQLLGCTVMDAESSEQALRLAVNQPPDIALVDFRLSDTDNGLIAIQKLRTRYPGLPAIIISGVSERSQCAQIEASGITLLPKPVLVESLKMTMISALCARETAVVGA